MNKSPAFFSALKSSAVVAAALRVTKQRTELIEQRGHVGVIAEAIAEDKVLGECALLQRLGEMEAELRRQTGAARASAGELREFCDAARAAVEPILAMTVREELELPDEILKLEALVAGFGRAREIHRERLRDVGLADDAIERAGVSPSHDDRARWEANIKAKRDRLRRVKAFAASGPLFNMSLLEETVAGS